MLHILQYIDSQNTDGEISGFWSIWSVLAKVISMIFKNLKLWKKKINTCINTSYNYI